MLNFYSAPARSLNACFYNILKKFKLCDAVFSAVLSYSISIDLDSTYSRISYLLGLSNSPAKNSVESTAAAAPKKRFSKSASERGASEAVLSEQWTSVAPIRYLSHFSPCEVMLLTACLNEEDTLESVYKDLKQVRSYSRGLACPIAAVL